MRYGLPMTSDTTSGPARKRKPKPTPSAPFVGGPLDGQTFMKHHSGRWSIYLDNTGKHIAPRTGDRLARTGFGEGCYVHREELDEANETWRPVYRHSSTLPQRAS